MTTAAAPGSAAKPAPPRVTPASDRLQRLLALVPYVVSRNVVGLAETAAAFGITERELVDDLNMLWCVELRSPDPYCPIDLSYEGGEIVVSEAESIDRPLRLGVDEASALLVALRMLAEVPNLEDRSALNRTIAKLEAAAGEAGAASAQVAVQVDDRGASTVLAQMPGRPEPGPAAAPVLLRARTRRGHRARCGPDAAAGRGGPGLPGGLVPSAEAVRLFRLDRVLALTVLDQAASVPPQAEPRDVDQGLFRPSADDAEVELELSVAGRWVAEYYPCERVEIWATGGSGSGCAPRTPGGSGGSPCGSARTAG